MLEYNKDCLALDQLQKEALNIYGKYDLNKSLIWMTEEFGEVIQAIRKQKSKEDITEEIGDLFAWIICISNILDIKLEQAVNTTFSKEINRQIREYGQLKYCEGLDQIAISVGVSDAKGN